MDDETFPCIRCGRTVYHAALSCPYCGLELYPEGDDALEVAAPTPRRFPPGLAHGVTMIASLLVTTSLTVLLMRLAASSLYGLAPLSAGLLGALVAGYLLAAFAVRASLASTVVYGLLNAGNALLLAPAPLTVLLLAALPLCAGAVAMALVGRVVYRRLLHPPARRAGEDRHYLDLLQCLNFDQAQLERLVNYERRRAPAADRETLLRRALARWERDNRR